MFEEICDSDFWDNDLSWNTTSPELTTCFRNTVLVWVPACFLLIFLPFEILSLIKSKQCISWNYYNIIRQVVCICLVIASIGDCIINILEYTGNKVSVSSFISSFINLFIYIVLSVLYYFHRERGIITSGTSWFFLLFQVICNAPKLHAYIHLDHPKEYEWAIFILQYSLIIILFIMSCFSDSNQNQKDKHQKECPKASASFLSKITFWWFNNMAITGWKKPLTIDDLWQIRDGDKCSDIVKDFNKHWTKSLNKTNKVNVDKVENGNLSNNQSYNEKKQSKPGIIMTLTKTFWLYFLSGTIFRLGYDVIQFLSPIILRYLIQFVENENEPNWHGYAYTIALFIVTLIQMVSLNYYFHRMLVVGMRIRACLVGAIYRKSLRLSNSARNQATSGEIVNLMAVDAQRFMDLMTFINIIWAAPLQIILALWFLWDELGISILAGIAVMIITFPINGYITAVLKRMQNRQMKLKDERVKVMNEVLSGVKVLKLYGWETPFMEKILAIRKRELRQLKIMNYVNCITYVLWYCVPFFVSFASFAMYVLIDKNNVLDAQKAFVSLTLFNILRFPLSLLPNLITNLIMTAVSVKRINRFLNSPELDDYVKYDSNQDHAIVVENGSFSWGLDENSKTSKVSLQLKNINFNVKKGEFVAIVGSVGTGKSSLLSALLGEMEKHTGKVIFSLKNIAYVPQQAWIQNSSLKNNILFGKQYSESYYKTVLNSCALEHDLSILPGGDETEIGEKGINLSGGQKQRVSLARACYSKADLFIFDDPLSAVDSHVGKHIFNNVFSSESGILKNKTRILATNNLSFLAQTDKIIVIKDGRVSEMGSFEELMLKKQDFATLVNEFSLCTNQKTDENTENKQRALTIKNDKDEQELTHLVKAEKTELGSVKYVVYLRYFKSMTLIWCIIIIISYAFMQFAVGGLGIWLAEWSKDKSSGDQQQDFAQTIFRLLIYGVIGLSQALFVALGLYSMTKAGVKSSTKLHFDMLDSILHSPMSFFDTTPLGRILHRFSKDVDVCDNVLPMSLRQWLVCFFAALTTIIIISMQVPIFLLVVLPILILYYFIQRFFIVTSRQLKRLESITRSPIYSHFGETLSGVATIRAFSADNRFISESDTRVDKNQVCYYPNIVANRWLSIRLELIGNFIVFFSSIFAVIYRNSLDPGIVGLMVSYALNITGNLNWLVRMSAEIETNVVGVERILEYTDLDREASWYNDKVSLPVEWPDKGNIGFFDYSTRYRLGLSPVLNQVNVNIKSGEKIGIVGRTGAGKSSLTLALFRLIEPIDGKIIIDDINISELGLQQLRSRLTIIPQDPVLFSGNLRTNLDPFNKYSDADIWQSLELAHLRPFVKSLDSGLMYKVSESGENLSVGQRQLICLARALLRKTKVLVLDEATAAVDLETDSLIQTTIRNAFSHCTVLTIAHRLNTIMDSNRIMVLDSGKIAEFDSPDNLLSNSRSIFYSLAKDANIIN